MLGNIDVRRMVTDAVRFYAAAAAAAVVSAAAAATALAKQGLDTHHHHHNALNAILTSWASVTVTLDSGPSVYVASARAT